MKLTINIKIYRKKYYLKHKKRILNLMKLYYLKYKNKINKRNKIYYSDNKNIIKNKVHKYYQKNKNKISIYKKIYRKQNKDKIQKYFKKYTIKRRKKDINYKLLCYLRSRLYLAIKNNPKLSTTMKLVGCSIKQLKKYLESKFISDMSWNNYGKWHIDHIKPCYTFDLSKPEEQKKCFHYTNLQPLWVEDNLSKNGKNDE